MAVVHQLDAMPLQSFAGLGGHQRFEFLLAAFLGELSVTMRDATGPWLVPSVLRPGGRKED